MLLDGVWEEGEKILQGGESLIRLVAWPIPIKSVIFHEKLLIILVCTFCGVGNFYGLYAQGLFKCKKYMHRKKNSLKVDS